MRSVVFVAPFPLETTMRFVHGASRVPNVKLLGVVQTPPKGKERKLFADIVRVKDALSAADLIEGISALRMRHGHPHRIIGVLEPLQVQLAMARKHFDVPGTDPETADLFRDKAKMKDRLRAAGLPVARHRLIAGKADADAFAASVGFPMVLKPPAGMGAKATFRVRAIGELYGALEGMRASASNPVLAEEFLTGTEGSFDTITLAGNVREWSCSHYVPTPLEVLENPWIQWCCLLPHELGKEHEEVRKIGVRAIDVLGLRDGFTHMEWFRRGDGSFAIGEIAQRPPGANITRMIGLAHDIDPYFAWARAVIDGAFDGAQWVRRWAVGCAFLRGMGRGRVAALEGVDAAQKMVGKWVVEAKLPTVGAPKSDSYEGDGYVIVRDPSTDVVKKVLSTIIETVRVHYA
jgi:formate-dependent phosphoribosylglycinamide formyltransferase (GAR transformylase)